MKTRVLQASHPGSISHAYDVLRHGGLVAFPTDTVYGLAAMAFDDHSVMQLYAAKGRSHGKAIAILLSEASQLLEVAEKPGVIAMRLAERFWPGPLTLIVPRHPNISKAVSPLPTLGVRIPDHPIALSLLERTGPLAVTSANLSEEANTVTVEQVLKQLNGRIHLILDGGRTPGGVPSTVVDCTHSKLKILRKGPISKKDLEMAIKAH